MNQKLPPDQVANTFFKALMHNQCHVSWSYFSKKSQQEFLEWTLKDIYERNPEAAKAAKLGIPEVKLLFEKNDVSLMKTFWKRFFYNSGANEFFRFGYYETAEQSGNTATVKVRLQYPDGRTGQVEFKMFNERGNWRFGYVESGMPF